MEEFGKELVQISIDLAEHANKFENSHQKTLEIITDMAVSLENCWSRSNLGYHACVYYAGLLTPPQGAHFSVEWGLNDRVISGTVGDWVEYSPTVVFRQIYHRAGDPDIEKIRKDSGDLRERVLDAKNEILSIIRITLQQNNDQYLEEIRSRVECLEMAEYESLRRGMLSGGQYLSSDYKAHGQGVRIAPHQHVIVEMASLATPLVCARDLSRAARQAGSHFQRLGGTKMKKGHDCANIFIGHGHSLDWLLLKDFIKDRLALEYNEFDSVPNEGVSIVERLEQMLDTTSFAFLVLTAEDELADGRLQARMNVIHEVGLFQGRLGFRRAIIILEEGCDEFSNIRGLKQIRFPRGNISACFEKIRGVLEREGIMG
ncbi:MAG: nucleotide-binding protein [Rhodospirillaceae bacterium]|nr:nucleotide-binding protein [Rhodospirillaceae bacterium]